MQRFLFNSIAGFAVFCLPAWIACIILVCLIFMQDYFTESIFWAYSIDILSGGTKAFGIFPPYFFTIFILIIFLSSFKLKGMLRVYPVS